MKTYSSSLNAFPVAGQSKSNKIEAKRIAQIRILSRAFHKEPLTMLQAAKITGIERANICRLIDKMRKRGQIAITKFDFCPITNYPGVGFYTTRRELFPNYKPSNLITL